jgi:hypothetical protein
MNFLQAKLKQLDHQKKSSCTPLSISVPASFLHVIQPANRALDSGVALLLRRCGGQRHLGFLPYRHLPLPLKPCGARWRCQRRRSGK